VKTIQAHIFERKKKRAGKKFKEERSQMTTAELAYREQKYNTV
jgi:hypothetical protein